MSYFVTQAASASSMKNQPFLANWLLNTPLGKPGTIPPIFGKGVPSPEPSSTCLVAACGATASTSVPQAYGLDHKDERVIQFNLMIEKEFAGNILSVGYVGNMGFNLNNYIGNFNLPAPPLAADGCGVTTTITLPHPCQPYYAQVPLLSLIQLNVHDGIMNYNAMQVNFVRRYSKGLTVSSNFTWGKSLTDSGAMNEGCRTCNLWLSQREWYNYGNSNSDIRLRYAFTANYQLPFGMSLKGFAGQAIKGWQVNGLFAWSSGRAFNVSNSKPQINNGSTSDRPNGLPRSDINPTIDQWFDTSAFALQAYGTAGNLSVNSFQGPPQRRFDFSVFKDFFLMEGVKLQFRMEMFNLTNTPSFATPGASISTWTTTDPATARPTQAGNFGKITATSQFYTPRDVQFALKLIF
jgi:hypothetical protein